MRIPSIAAVVLTLSLGAICLHSQSANSMIGVWKVAEIVSPQGEQNSNPQPTMYIFTARHYSHVSVTSPTPRPNFGEGNLTDAQWVQMWEPFSATAGTYDLRGNTLTIRPIVAKNPAFMSGGTFTSFELTVEGKDVWIRATGSHVGSIPGASANRVKLVRLE
jgi:hypothetical protein